MAVIKYKDPADGQWKTLPPGGIGQVEADARYVKKSGDEMSGTLSMTAGTLSFPSGQQGIRWEDAKKALVSGYGNDVTVIELPNGNYGRLRVATPTLVEHAATKGYVDSRIVSVAVLTAVTGATEAIIVLPGYFAACTTVQLTYRYGADAIDARKVKSLSVNSINSEVFIQFTEAVTGTAIVYATGLIYAYPPPGDPVVTEEN